MGSDDAPVPTPRRADLAPRPREGTFRALVVGTDDWAVERSARVLADSRCEVARCHEPGEPAFPCNLLRPDRDGCPIDRVDVVVDVRTSATARPAPGEMGAVCALRAGRPLVLAGLSARNPLGQWATSVVGPAGDLRDACLTAVVGQTIDLREPPVQAPAT